MKGPWIGRVQRLIGAVPDRLVRLRGALPALPGGARLWVGLASLGFVLAALLGQARAMAQLALEAQGWAWLAFGVGVSLLSLVANGLAWVVVLRWLGHAPQPRATVLLFLRSNLRKYLPGGIWHLSERITVLCQGGIACPLPLPTHRAVLAVLLEPVLMAAAALALVPLGLLAQGLGFLRGSDLLFLAALLPLVALVPRWFEPLMGRLERRRAVQLVPGDGAPGAIPEPPALPGYPLAPLLAEGVFVLLRFGGFACCVLAFDQQQSLGWGTWLSGFALAWTVGLVVPGAPGGFGVFEATLLLRLGADLPAAPLLAVALSYRLVTVAADLVAAATARVDQRWLAAAERRAP